MAEVGRYTDDFDDDRGHLTPGLLAMFAVGSIFIWLGVYWFIRGVALLAQAIRG